MRIVGAALQPCLGPRGCTLEILFPGVLSQIPISWLRKFLLSVPWPGPGERAWNGGGPFSLTGRKLGARLAPRLRRLLLLLGCRLVLVPTFGTPNRDLQSFQCLREPPARLPKLAGEDPYEVSARGEERAFRDLLTATPPRLGGSCRDRSGSGDGTRVSDMLSITQAKLSVSFFAGTKLPCC